MLDFYLSYLRAFTRYADMLFNRFGDFSDIGKFAILLTKKARELLCRAALNKTTRMATLERDIYEAGKRYIKRFSCRFKIKIAARHDAGDGRAVGPG